MLEAVKHIDSTTRRQHSRDHLRYGSERQHMPKYEPEPSR
jgi:hypothetical protein